MDMIPFLTPPGWSRRTQAARIPQEVRFVWGLIDGHDAVPPQYDRYLESWRRLHPTWNVTVHTKREIQEIAAQYAQYPFASYAKDIQRCDVCRPMLLHRHGGVYSDLDVEPRACLDHLFARQPKANVFLAVETVVSRHSARQIGRRMPIRNGIPEIRRRIANYFMASIPGHPFWIETLQRIRSRASLAVREQYDILYTTGPDVITEAIHHNARRFKDVVVVPKRVIDRFIKHHCAGSWRNF